MPDPIATRVIPSVSLAPCSPREVSARFRKRLGQELTLRISGEGQHDPAAFLRRYPPQFRIDLFDTEFHLAKCRQNTDIRFYVVYLVQGRQAFARLFYKDVSLVWRSASHIIRSDEENWIGKGDVQLRRERGMEFIESDEATTDLPVEMQSALESLLLLSGKPKKDDVAPVLVLRGAPNDRIAPYRDFTEPRRKAAADRRNLVHGGRRVARFLRKTDPRSLRIQPGFEPDFRRGILEVSESKSSLYGGMVRRYRILSKNMRIQYGFFAGPNQVWIGTLQSTTAELSSFGVRTIDVAADEDFLLPGFEYHYLDDCEDPPEFVSQIPKGFAGEASTVDPVRSDASPWLDRVPVIEAFRRQVLGAKR